MILVYIEDNYYLNYITNFLDYSSLNYTTNFNSNYQYLLVAEINNKTLNLIRENLKLNKKIIFFTYIEEKKIDKHYNKTNKYSTNYTQIINYIINNSYKVIVSLPYYKKILNKGIVIPLTNDYKNINTKKSILIVDKEYSNLKNIYELTEKYPKINFVIKGYKPTYLLKKRDSFYLNKFGSNVKLVKNNNIFRKYKTVIYFDSDILDILNYLGTSLNLIIKNNMKWDGYFINYKNIYLFNDNNLLLVFDKLINKKLSNLSIEAYKIVNNIKFDTIANKFNNILK